VETTLIEINYFVTVPSRHLVPFVWLSMFGQTCLMRVVKKNAAAKEQSPELANISRQTNNTLPLIVTVSNSQYEHRANYHGDFSTSLILTTEIQYLETPYSCNAT
jgi:hypothetical protein